MLTHFMLFLTLPSHHNIAVSIPSLINLVILDYKTLTLLLVKNDDDGFMLGGRGVSVEFCFVCNAIRVSNQNII